MEEEIKRKDEIIADLQKRLYSMTMKIKRTPSPQSRLKSSHLYTKTTPKSKLLKKIRKNEPFKASDFSLQHQFMTSKQLYNESRRNTSYMHNYGLSMDSTGHCPTLEQIVEDTFNEDNGQIVMLMKRKDPNKKPSKFSKNSRIIQLKNKIRYKESSFKYPKIATKKLKNPVLEKASSSPHNILDSLFMDSSNRIKSRNHSELSSLDWPKRPPSRNSMQNSSGELTSSLNFRKPFPALSDSESSRPASRCNNPIERRNQSVDVDPIKPLAKAKKASLVDQILYNDLDKDSWNQVLKKIREDPILLSEILKPGEKIEFEKISPRQRRSVTPYKSSREGFSTDKLSPRPKPARAQSAYPKNLENSSSKIIPRSPSKLERANSFGLRTYKVRNADWSQSTLDSLSNKLSNDFNQEKDVSIFNSAEIEDLLISSNSLSKEDQATLQYKGLATLEKLRTELLLPGSYSATKNAENLTDLLKKCSNLIRARALTLKILKLIHAREDTILSLMSLEETNTDLLNTKYSDLLKITEEISQAIGFWKQLVPYSSFIYLGEDYFLKLHEDLANVRSVYPQLKSDDLTLPY